jgi:hypothetical protein
LASQNAPTASITVAAAHIAQPIGVVTSGSR